MSSRLTRRRLIGSGAGVAVSVPLAALAPGCGENGGSDTTTTEAGARSGTAPDPPRNGDEALERLLEGNERFVQGRLLNERRGDVRRAKIAEGQEPFAIVLGCSDSRVPPEVLFDQGLGELFVVRVAGNTASDPVVLGSIEYAAEHLGSVLLMVLGHERCGAVEGAVQVVTEGAKEPGSIDQMIDPVVPAVEEVSRSARDLPQEELVSRSVRANVKRNVEELENGEPLLGHLIEEDELNVVGAEYDLETGEVKLV